LNPLRRNVIANLVGRVATALLWVAITPYVLSRLGAERFGIWALFFAFSGYLTTFDLGIGNTMIRFIAVERAAGDRRGLKRTLGRGFRLSLTLGLFWAATVALGRGWIAHAFHVPPGMLTETDGALLIFAAGVLLLLPVQVMSGTLQGFERLDLSNLCMFFGVAAQVLAIFVGLATGGGLKAVALAGVIGQAVTGGLSVIALRIQVRKVESGASGPEATWRDLVHYGAALQLTNTLGILQLQVGKILLGLLGNLRMVADYELGFRVAGGVTGLPILILGAVAPTVTRLWESDGPEAVGSLFTSTLRWLYTHSVLALGTLWLLAPDVTNVWLGPGHDRIAFQIRLWVLAYAMNIAWSLAPAFARCIGRPWIEVWCLAATVIANISLALWSVPRYGTVGAIVALGVAYGVGFITFAAISWRSGIPYGSWIRSELVPRVLVSGLTVGLCEWLLTAGPLSAHLPSPGWAHAAVAGLLFLTLFALFFLPFGDTQRLSRTLWQMSATIRVKRASSR